MSTIPKCPDCGARLQTSLWRFVYNCPACGARASIHEGTTFLMGIGTGLVAAFLLSIVFHEEPLQIANILGMPCVLAAIFTQRHRSLRKSAPSADDPS